jgi:hypothetical protein
VDDKNIISLLIILEEEDEEHSRDSKEKHGELHHVVAPVFILE